MLTRLHVPAGKAVALAAMPTAVLMGMGLTPQLAGAKPLPKNPFQDGPCVSAPDKEAEQEKDKKREKDREKAERTEQAAEPEPGKIPAPQESPAAGTGEDGSGDGDGDARRRAPETGTTAPEPATEPSGAAEAAEEEQERNPLDPLGLGDALEDLLTPDDRSERQETPETGTASSGSPEPSTGTSDTPVKEAAEKAGEELEEAAEKTRKAAGDDKGTAKETAEDAVGKAGDAEAGEKAAGDAEKAEDAGETGEDASGKEPFPCPTYDARALADAEEEPTEALLPDAPWRLETSLLTLHGLDYHGIVKVRTYGGKIKNVLKFTASAVDIRDLHQIVEGPGGTAGHVQAARGSTSTIRDGTVTMYTEELKGKLFGLIPITFSPESPPPLNVPEVFFTEVSVTQAGQFGGTLHIPGMHLYNEG
ncbi:hydrogenase expression protein HypF [Streptomyces carminius]|uniref:Hydrogenase expression protein HypF n=1 Tax=Streptomyces carminius TaxID=2665496 RepID=A0A2M8LWG0_9ACTN|nr:hydrogenase expression protein HypF [Streptomyces carminius]